MNIYTNISNSIAAGWVTAGTWADEVIANVAIGEGNCCKDLQIVMLIEWIQTLQNYLDWNFDDVGRIVVDPPIQDCVSQADILELAAKVSSLEC